MRKLIVMLTLLASQARAAVPTTFSVEGVLRDGAGKLQSTMVNVSVSLYDAQAAGTLLAGPFGPTPAMATNGLFSLPINDAAITAELGAAAQVWLEVSVGNDTFARQLVSSQLYALMCGTADLAKALPNVTVSPTGRVGIGTTTPGDALDVVGTVGVIRALGASPAGSYDANVLLSLSNSNKATEPRIFDITTDANNNAVLRAVTGNTLFPAGNVGIGTTNPLSTLTVNGANASLRIGSGNDNGYVFENDNADNFKMKLRYKNPTNVYSEIMTFQYAGNVGIQNTNPATLLHLGSANSDGPTNGIQLGDSYRYNIYHSNANTLIVEANGDVDYRQGLGTNNGSGNIVFMTAAGSATGGTGASTEKMRIDRLGNVGINTPTPDATLTVNGTADKAGGGSWATYSDERLKNIKGGYSTGLDVVMQLEPIRYEYKKDNALGVVSDGEHIGFSAQAVQKLIPEAVTRNDKGYLLVNNDPILWSMLNAVKEQQREIRALRAQVDELRRASTRRAQAN